jgi:hypothetical protein
MIKNSKGKKTMSIKEANKRSGARLRKRALALTKSWLDPMALAFISADFIFPKSITSSILLYFIAHIQLHRNASFDCLLK